jgi:hypothetical protein
MSRGAIRDSSPFRVDAATVHTGGVPHIGQNGPAGGRKGRRLVLLEFFHLPPVSLQQRYLRAGLFLFGGRQLLAETATLASLFRTPGVKDIDLIQGYKK